ncbi:MAG: prolyl-tRNA synthetase associated domain-containing protein [Candidatus Aminicenantes bacterium]|nr:prolyl-tRNA synthetase associated domain-containing protein [Candidatus Aminicenantes bacterium]
MTTAAEEKVYGVLKDWGIDYVRLSHPPVYTVEEAEKHWSSVEGAHCKNIFVRNKKGNRHYLIIVRADKKVDLTPLSKRMGQSRFSFASPERLLRYLGLEPGSVSPFGLINDEGKEVRVLIDRDLKSVEKINFHPNVNTATLTVTFTGFEKFLEKTGHSVQFIDV